MGKNSDELSNTVMYSDLFPALMVYPNGDGEKRGKTAIILKIPKKVFTHEQGVFEYLPNGAPTLEEQRMNSINFINKNEAVEDNLKQKNDQNKEEK